jgi:hypothetical protein
MFLNSNLGRIGWYLVKVSGVIQSLQLVSSPQETQRPRLWLNGIEHRIRSWDSYIKCYIWVFWCPRIRDERTVRRFCFHQIIVKPFWTSAALQFIEVGNHDDRHFFLALILYLQTLFEVDKRVGEGALRWSSKSSQRSYHSVSIRF